MTARSGIDHRWSVLPPTPAGGIARRRGRVLRRSRPALDLGANGGLCAARPRPCDAGDCRAWRCVRPGVDHPHRRRELHRFRRAGDRPDPRAAARPLPTVERVLIGFMGCYAGVTALRTARHIVRSEPDAVVLVVSVELSTLHLSLADEPEPLLAMLQFSDGAAAPGPTSSGNGWPLARDPYSVGDERAGRVRRRRRPRALDQARRERRRRGLDVGLARARVPGGGIGP